MDPTQVQIISDEPKLKSLTALRLLALIEVVMGILEIHLKSIGDGLIIMRGYFFRSVLCTYGTGVWAGILGVISGALGLIAFRTAYGKNNLMVAHFIMSII